ncbi:hypothetical protein AAFF_G00275330 [Aldrovandia affinis]|uniref:Uncharacterized protein n=1 Tax=Aldrovandia affinis TaxID=143900 RepID=A0AAD7STU6_9TELE|nr:hypothetical protein AAFF_G00275330 [Aldrovandia affinis]
MHLSHILKPGAPLKLSPPCGARLTACLSASAPARAYGAGTCDRCRRDSGFGAHSFVLPGGVWIRIRPVTDVVCVRLRFPRSSDQSSVEAACSTLPHRDLVSGSSVWNGGDGIVEKANEVDGLQAGRQAARSSEAARGADSLGCGPALITI